MMARLGDICKIKSGYAFKSESFSDVGVPVVRIGNIMSDGINVDYSICYDTAFWNDNSNYRVEKNDILVAMSGATVGKACINTLDIPLLLNQRVASIVCDNPITQKYVYHVINSNEFLEYVIDNSAGCAQPNISAKQLANFQLKVYDLKIQERIVTVLDGLSHTISLRKQQISKLDELVKSRFIELFGDPIKNSNGRSTTEFINVVKMQRGFDLPVQDRVQNGKIPVFGSNGALDRHNVAKVFGGGVITGRSGTIGKVYYTEGDYWPLNTSLFSVDTHGNNIIYLAHLLQLFDLSRFTEGTGVPTLNRNKFHNQQIIDVPLAEQEEFATFVEQIEKSKFEIQKSLEKLETLKKALMQKYFG